MVRQRLFRFAGVFGFVYWASDMLDLQNSTARAAAVSIVVTLAGLVLERYNNRKHEVPQTK